MTRPLREVTTPPQRPRRKRNWLLPPEILDSLESPVLFYPCSGNDLAVPIEAFSPAITEFWFVDHGYFSPGHQDTRRYGYDVAAGLAAPVLAGSPAYEHLDTTVEGPPEWRRQDRDIIPCIRSERYRHRATGRVITIRRRRGYGFSAFRTEIDRLGVFFYRGDSLGEGGSGNFWLASDHMREVCAKLVDGGLIVTDGSNTGGGRSYSRLAEWHWSATDRREVVAKAGSFSVDGRTFTCVGYLGQRYGPTLVWQVRKLR
jgi:hypothetical protein